MSTNEVSDDELINDYKLTHKEWQAYVKLCEAYEDLQQLPENLTEWGFYKSKIIKYTDSKIRCKRFLDFLEKEISKRGLTW